MGAELDGILASVPLGAEIAAFIAAAAALAIGAWKLYRAKKTGGKPE